MIEKDFFIMNKSDLYTWVSINYFSHKTINSSGQAVQHETSPYRYWSSGTGGRLYSDEIPLRERGSSASKQTDLRDHLLRSVRGQL